MHDVRYIGATGEQVRWGSCDDPRSLLTAGQVYRVQEVEEHSWHTKYRLVGIVGWFNSVCFEMVRHRPVEEPVRPPDPDPEPAVTLTFPFRHAQEDAPTPEPEPRFEPGGGAFGGAGASVEWDRPTTAVSTGESVQETTPAEAATCTESSTESESSSSSESSSDSSSSSVESP